jgi:signal peptidase I
VFGTIHRGDVIVFEFDERKAEEAKSHLVKRVLGTPGDRVELKGGTVFVNGNSERAPRRGIPMHEGLQLHDEVWEVPRRGQAVQLTSENLARWQPLIQREGHTALLSDGNKTLIDGKSASRYTIEENYYFVLGDHREASSDSRVWGFVPEQDIVGEALIVYWSWDTEAQPSGIVEKILSIRWSRIGNLIR